MQRFQLSPVVDGRTLPAHPFDPVAPAISANVPLMIGSTETEVTWNNSVLYDPLDDAALHNRIKNNLRIDDAAADQLIGVYKKGRPQASNLDLFFIMSTDVSNFRTGTDTEAERKAELRESAGLQILLPMVFAGAGRQAAVVSHTGHSVRVRERRDRPVDGRLRVRNASRWPIR